MKISVAAPVFNEESLIDELVARVAAVLDEIPGGPHEFVLVDDGSTDGTADAIRRHAAQDDRIRLVQLSRNFGHQVAMTAALHHVSGDAVYLMDGDLQDPPEALPAFLNAMEDGYDVVYGRRVRRKEGLLLRTAYFVSYRLIALFSNIRLPLDSGDHSLISRRVVDAMCASPEQHRYLRGLRTWVGFRQTAIPVERAERHSGRSKYSLLRLLGLATDGLLAFSTAPLRAASVLGLFAIALSLLYTSYAVAARIWWGTSPQGFTALLVAVVFLGGIQMLLLGVLGEYVGRIYEEVKRRPAYFVRDRIGFAHQQEDTRTLRGNVDSGATDE